MNQPRPPGRGGAFMAITFVAIALSQTLLAGSSTTTAYARPLQPAPRTSPTEGSAQTALTTSLATGLPTALLPGSAPSWEVFPPAPDAVILPGRQSVQVPILMYHYIRVPPDPGSDRLGFSLSVSPQDFRQQLDYLAREGFHPITAADLQGYLDGRNSLPDRPVVLTFDDGYADLYTEAFPILREHNFKAVAYIVSGFVGAPGRNVTAEQIREMDAYGIEIGAHTFSHSDLTKMGPDQLQAEIAGSRAQLEGLVGHPVVAFCYPAGRYNPQVVDAVRAAGFANATTTQEGVAHSNDDRFSWTRVRVSGGETLADFAARLQDHENGTSPARPAPIRLPRAFPFIFLGVMGDLK